MDGGKVYSTSEYTSRNMFILKVAIFIILTYLSAGIITAWYKAIIYNEQFTYIPFIGGILGCVALYINPFCELGWFVVTPFFIDYYSFPYFICILIKKIKSYRNPDT